MPSFSSMSDRTNQKLIDALKKETSLKEVPYDENDPRWVSIGRHSLQSPGSVYGDSSLPRKPWDVDDLEDERVWVKGDVK